MTSPRETMHFVITETVEDGDFNSGVPLDSETIATQAPLIRQQAMAIFLPQGAEYARQIVYVGNDAWVVEVSRNELGITGMDEKNQPTKAVVRGDNQITSWSWEEGGRTNTDIALKQVKGDMLTVLANARLPQARLH